MLESLRNARLNKGYTTYRVAREVGITVMSYVHYERLRAFPHRSMHYVFRTFTTTSRLFVSTMSSLSCSACCFLPQRTGLFAFRNWREVPLFVPLDHFIHLPAEDSSDGREVSPSLQNIFTISTKFANTSATISFS